MSASQVNNGPGYESDNGPVQVDDGPGYESDNGPGYESDNGPDYKFDQVDNGYDCKMTFEEKLASQKQTLYNIKGQISRAKVELSGRVRRDALSKLYKQLRNLKSRIHLTRAKKALRDSKGLNSNIVVLNKTIADLYVEIASLTKSSNEAKARYEIQGRKSIKYTEMLEKDLRRVNFKYGYLHDQIGDMSERVSSLKDENRDLVEKISKLERGNLELVQDFLTENRKLEAKVDTMVANEEALIARVRDLESDSNVAWFMVHSVVVGLALVGCLLPMRY